MDNILKTMGMYPWAIQRAELDKIVAIANRSNEIESLAAKNSGTLSNTHKVEIRAGIAIIPIFGSIIIEIIMFDGISTRWAIVMGFNEPNDCHSIYPLCLAIVKTQKSA